MKLARRALLAMAASLVLPLSAAAQPAPVTADDRVMGRADAPVTIIAYVSTTCGHCADWYLRDFEPLKLRFIWPGYVRIVFRELMTAPAQAAFAATAIARCAPGDEYFDVLQQLYYDHDQLTQGGDVGRWLRAGGRAGGLDEAAVTACLGDEAALREIQARWEQAGADGVRGTPTFFINGRRFAGHSYSDFDTELRRLIPDYEDPDEALWDMLRSGG